MASHWLCNEGKKKTKISGAKADQGLTAAELMQLHAHAGEAQAPVVGAAKSADKPAKPSKAAVRSAHTEAGANATAGPAGAACKQSRLKTRPKVSVFSPEPGFDGSSAVDESLMEVMKVLFCQIICGSSRGSKNHQGKIT